MASAVAHNNLTIQADSVVRFRPLFFRSHGQAEGEWVVGHAPSDTAIALPWEGVVVIEQLQLGKTVAESSEVALRECGDEVDVQELVQELSELGLVESIDGQMLAEPETVSQGWLSSIPTASVSWLFAWPALLIYCLLIVAGPLAFVLDPASRPEAQNLLWSPSYTVDILTLLLLTPFLLLKHEFGHLLAARAKGLAAGLTFGNRLFYVVAVSRVAGIWKLARRERMLIYSAGMGADCVVAGLCALALLAADQQLFALPIELRGLLGLVILSEYVGVAWEFQIFFKTDVYHIFADITDRHDLPERARALLSTCWQRVVRCFLPKHAESSPVAYDWLTIAYTLLLVIGVGGSLFWFCFFLLPASISAAQGEIMRLSMSLGTGDTRDWLAVLDAALALIFQFALLLLLLWSMRKMYRAHRGRLQAAG